MVQKPSIIPTHDINKFTFKLFEIKDCVIKSTQTIKYNKIYGKGDS